MITPYYTYDPATKRLTHADDPATIDGRLVVHPSAAMCAKIGAYPLADPMPPAPTPPEGKVAVFDGYELALIEPEDYVPGISEPPSEMHWVQKWRFDDSPPPPPKVYSTSDLIYALMSRGVYDQCRQWIEEHGLRDLILATKEFTDDLENFETIKRGLQELLHYTDEQVAEVLAEAEVG